MTAPPSISTVGIVGGSLGGLFHALALAELGLDVNVWERSTGRPDDRGAGIVLQPSVAWFLSEFTGVDPSQVSVPVTHRQLFTEDGNIRVMPMRQQMISWGTIYKALRDALPAERYHDGQPVTTLTPAPAGATIHAGDTAHAVDLAIIADGSASAHRGLVAPEGAPRYAGYVAYRGVIDEADLPQESTARFRDRFSFYHANRTQFLCYFIPGDFGTTTPGRRRMNWVWYVPADTPELERITTDRNGTGHGLSLPPGLIAPHVHTDLMTRARSTLPQPLHELIEHTREPFLQAILDGRVTTMRNNRTLLTGDAAFTIRPHTAASTEKAAADAITLYHTLQQAPTTHTALQTWEQLRLTAGTTLHSQGINLAHKLDLNTTHTTTTGRTSRTSPRPQP